MTILRLKNQTQHFLYFPCFLIKVISLFTIFKMASLMTYDACPESQATILNISRIYWMNGKSIKGTLSYLLEYIGSMPLICRKWAGILCKPCFPKDQASSTSPGCTMSLPRGVITLISSMSPNARIISTFPQ